MTTHVKFGDSCPYHAANLLAQFVAHVSCTLLLLPFTEHLIAIFYLLAAIRKDTNLPVASKCMIIHHVSPPACPSP